MAVRLAPVVTEAAEAPALREPRSAGRWVPSTESLFVATFVLFAFRLGARAIADNSMLVHLRTGVEIAAGHGIPRADPYSYTAHGSAWVVQSWFPSWVYGWTARVGSLRLVVVEQALLMAVTAWLVVRLARAGTPVRTAVAGAAALGAGAAYWSPRPLLFGLLGMALTVTVVERRRSPWLLLPVVWVWANSHGSFPLGLAWIAARLAGEWFDRDGRAYEVARYLGAYAIGLVVASLNPLGPRLLAFALTVGAKRSVFRSIVEWRSPDFQQAQGLFTLVFLGLAVLVLLRAELPWRDLLPVAGFLVLGLLAVRNLPVAAIALAPALGRALRPTSPEAGGGDVRSPVNLAFAGILGLAFVVFAAPVVTDRPVNLRAYPVAATTWLDRQGLLLPPHRLAEQDVVGCYLVYRYGSRARAFVDDRYDMYPVAVSEDYDRLLKGGAGTQRVLDRRGVDVVLWDRHLALASILRASSGWEQVYVKGDWAVFRRI